MALQGFVKGTLRDVGKHLVLSFICSAVGDSGAKGIEGTEGVVQTSIVPTNQVQIRRLIGEARLFTKIET